MSLMPRHAVLQTDLKAGSSATETPRAYHCCRVVHQSFGVSINGKRVGNELHGRDAGQLVVLGSVTCSAASKVAH